MPNGGYRRLFEAAHDGILVIDPDSRKIIDENPFMVELLGYYRGDLLPGITGYEVAE